MDKVYHWLLYNLGFQVDEHFSDMLARQKLRWGKWWWIAPIFTIIVTVLLLIFEIWLTIHIVIYNLKKENKNGSN